MASPNDLSLPFAEELYARYRKDPGSVPPDWRAYFHALGSDPAFTATPQLGPALKPRSLFQAGPPRDGRSSDRDTRALQDPVDQLLRAFRVRGHMEAKLDPLGAPRADQPELDPAFYSFSARDLERKFSCDTLAGDDEELPLRMILQRMRATYCGYIGVQYMHIDDISTKRWLQRRLEAEDCALRLSVAEQRRILTRLTDAVIFEEFIQKKYLGAKSFSLEGGESLIPLLDLAIEKAGAQNIDEIVLAMPHRGRLNVLANIMGKNPWKIFREFDDRDPELHYGRGDVKYHLGYSSDWTTVAGRKVHLSLCFNPSHLELVGAVALGRVRAKQDRVGDSERSRGMALIMHGDAAFAAEGIVQEMLNLSQLEGYATGGAIHIIVNNQIGFTTSPSQARSSTYATDVAKMLQSPIFHVNGEHPEAVAQVVDLAMDFRKEFRSDVVIDMYCYRRRGHNEGDEPAFTQPLLYAAIEKRKSVRDGYVEHLLELGGITRAEADRLVEERRLNLERELAAAREAKSPPAAQTLTGIWEGRRGGPEQNLGKVATGVSAKRLRKTLLALASVPDDFHPHPKIERWLEHRREMAHGTRPLDWGAGEALALATLAEDGMRVRLTGQDSERGTFSHRHATLHDIEDGRTFYPFQQLSADQAPVDIINSPLSETGVLGFDYGYSLDCPDGLILWEAQFGDFVNVAQPIIDQFISSAEDKWQRLSGLVMLLPHGFEGMGPEHSSARLERFLGLAADDNLQVVNPTTPAQLFHLLRRQMLRRWRKPLVIMTPKSLLRHPKVASTLGELQDGRFERVLGDGAVAPQRVTRVLLCTGKIYFDLEPARGKSGRDDVAILRVEQLYPLPDEVIAEALAPFPADAEVVWVQEEPANMGAWPYLRARFCERMAGRPFRGLYRDASASPATGSAASHKHEQEEILEHAFSKPAAKIKESRSR